MFYVKKEALGAEIYALVANGDSNNSSQESFKDKLDCAWKIL